MSDAQDNAPKRVVGKPFAKGTSGNPGGQPKAYAEVRKLLDSGVLAAAETMLRLASDEDGDPKVRMAAAKDILDRTLGKAKESIEHSTDANGVLAAVIEAMRSRAP